MDFSVELGKGTDSIDPIESELESVWKGDAPAKRMGKKVLHKPSVNGVRVNKRIKLKKEQPNFVLDSFSIQDKLCTQPDAERLVTQVSNC